jgi:hypothetical protein
MKYFTPDLVIRFGSDDDQVANAAAAEWEEVVGRYEQRLQQILSEMPRHLREFAESLLLHDADVWSLARQDGRLLMVLCKDIAPRDVVLLTYQLVAEPIIDKAALPPEHCSSVMQFLYDEIDLSKESGQRIYTQSILFSNGWEVQLQFTDVRVELAEPVYPTLGSRLVPAPPAVIPQSA